MVHEHLKEAHMQAQAKFHDAYAPRSRLVYAMLVRRRYEREIAFQVLTPSTYADALVHTILRTRQEQPKL